MIQFILRKGVDSKAWEPDFGFWLGLEWWTLWEAVCLVLNENPPRAMCFPEFPIEELDHQFTSDQDQLLARAIRAATGAAKPLRLYFENRSITIPHPHQTRLYVFVSPYEFITWAGGVKSISLPEELVNWHENKTRELEEDGGGDSPGILMWGECFSADEPSWQPITHDRRKEIIEEGGLDLLVDDLTFYFKSGKIREVTADQLQVFMHFVEADGPCGLPDNGLGKAGRNASKSKLERMCDKAYLDIPRDRLLKKHSKGKQRLELLFPPREGYKYLILQRK